MGACCSSVPKAGRSASNHVGVLTEKPSSYKAAPATQQQKQTWAVTGIVSLRDSNLKDPPAALLATAETVRVLDVSNNRFRVLHESLAALTALERLTAAQNHITAIECRFEALKRLRALDLDGNQLTTIPEDIGECKGLEILRLSRNRLRSIPTALHNCSRLKLLAVSNNVITCLPPPLGNCSSLESIEASHNALVDVPAALSRLARLRSLILNGNADLKGIPGEILVRCERLHTLEVHDTQITREVLQQTEGYDRFEVRRRAKYTKAVEGGALLGRNGMDEGVDVALRD